MSPMDIYYKVLAINVSIGHNYLSRVDGGSRVNILHEDVCKRTVQHQVERDRLRQVGTCNFSRRGVDGYCIVWLSSVWKRRIRYVGRYAPLEIALRVSGAVEDTRQYGTNRCGT